MSELMSEMVVVGALTAVVLIVGIAAWSTVRVVIGLAEHVAGEAQKQRDVVVMLASAMKAQTPQEVAELAVALKQASWDPEAELEEAGAHEPMKPDHITDVAGEKYEIFENEDGTAIMRTEDGRELEIL